MATTRNPGIDVLHPIYRRSLPRPWSGNARPASSTSFIDLDEAHIPPYGATVAEATAGFDMRAAAAVSAAIGLDEGVNVLPSGQPGADLLEEKYRGSDDAILIPTAKCLAAMAYKDYFPDPDPRADDLRSMVSDAIMAASPGWCGSFGPGVGGTLDVVDKDHAEGNYDMSQMHLLQIAYRYYDELRPDARDRLIRVLLATGRITRPNQHDLFTSGRVPNDWSRVGFLEVPLPVIGNLLGIHVKVKRIGETENHVLTTHTARYLTNQLLYQHDHDPDHDNRRNKSMDAPSCTELTLILLRNILRDDFSEYNAKNYQNETRSALLNLCSFAYDHEVRLAARLVLDYLSARIAVSSNDLRRMVPFRRRNEGKNVSQADGFMTVALLETTFGSDPMPQRFAMLAGNTRAYEAGRAHSPRAWSIKTDGSDGNEAIVDALSDYRIPASIHDLFITDLHRRFFQRLHRTPQDDVNVTGRNCDNHEIYAGSPSYLITAGGSPATYAIDPTLAGIVMGKQATQLGVALPTSFMPTGCSAGGPVTGTNALDLIQFSTFSSDPGTTINYGVAPDFACGHRVKLPGWCVTAIVAERRGKFDFVNKRGADGRPGFYLAILRDGEFAVMEAFDTWLHPELSFEQFRRNVWDRNHQLSENGLHSNVEARYTTQNGNRIRFVIWKRGDGKDVEQDGASLLGIEYGPGDPVDSLGDAGNEASPFLRGTVMNSTAEGSVDITNHFLGTKVTLDMRELEHPRRIDESGAVEEAGSNHEVWVDFAWNGPHEGDFFRPFKAIAAAVAAVAVGGVIKLMPGSTDERPVIPGRKRMKLVAPLGDVVIGVR